MVPQIEPYIITLGTAGGPKWWLGPTEGKRTGISTAVVVGDAVYLVDCGYGAGRQLQLSGEPLEKLRGVFLTHLHSDHVVDLPALIMFGMVTLAGRREAPIPIVGPGRRGKLPPVSPRAIVPPRPVAPENPVPGTRDLFDGIQAAFATDINDRVLNALREPPHSVFEPRDIEIPGGTGFDPNDDPCPDMEPFEVYRDENVAVSAILVSHAPLAPAFAFRFDTAGGSVTISGDTSPCDNMVRLARDSDVLLHEAIDFAWVEASYRSVGSEFARASIDHHRRAHTSPEQAVEIAIRSGAKTLVLHHLVPGAGPDEVWEAAGSAFPGRFIVAEDLQVIAVRDAEAGEHRDRHALRA